MTAVAVGIDGGKTDEERERNRPDRDPANQPLGKTKVPSQQAVDGGAGEREQGDKPDVTMHKGVWSLESEVWSLEPDSGLKTLDSRL